MSLRFSSQFCYRYTLCNYVRLLCFSPYFCHRYTFCYDDWLAIDEGQGRLDEMLIEGRTVDRKSLFDNNVQTNLLNDHLWFSIAYRKSLSTFTRVQRLSCCIAILYLSMIASAMWYKTDDVASTQNALIIGPISLTVHELYVSLMSSVTIIPVVLGITLLFSKSAPWPETKEHAYRGKGQLPWWCAVIGWILVIMAISTSCFFTILYSFEWGSVKSTAWLTAFVMSFVESVLLIQPLKVHFHFHLKF